MICPSMIGGLEQVEEWMVRSEWIKFPYHLRSLVCLEASLVCLEAPQPLGVWWGSTMTSVISVIDDLPAAMVYSWGSRSFYLQTLMFCSCVSGLVVFWLRERQLYGVRVCNLCFFRVSKLEVDTPSLFSWWQRSWCLHKSHHYYCRARKTEIFKGMIVSSTSAYWEEKGSVFTIHFLAHKQAKSNQIFWRLTSHKQS